MDYYPEQVALYHLGESQVRRLIRNGQVYSLTVEGGHELWHIQVEVLVRGKGLISRNVTADNGRVNWPSWEEAMQQLAVTLGPESEVVLNSHLRGSGGQLLCGLDPTTRTRTRTVVEPRDFPAQQWQCDRCRLNGLALGILEPRPDE